MQSSQVQNWCIKLEKRPVGAINIERVYVRVNSVPTASVAQVQNEDMERAKRTDVTPLLMRAEP
jgi:hypothetical protein